MGRSYFPCKTPGGTEFNTIFNVDPNDGRILASCGIQVRPGAISGGTDSLAIVNNRILTLGGSGRYSI